MFKVEWLKLYKRKSVKVLLGVYSVMLVLMSLVYIFSEKRFGLSLYSEGQFISASLKMVMAFILPFISLYIASNSFGLEFSKGTYKNMLLLPVTKTELFLNKLLAIMTLLGGILLIQFSYSLLLSIVLDGGFTIGFLVVVIIEYLGALMMLGLVASMGALISMVITSTGLSVLIGYLMYAGMGVLSIYYPVLKPISLTYILSNYNHLLSSGFGIQLLSLIAYYIITVTMSLMLFDKKDEDICLYE